MTTPGVRYRRGAADRSGDPGPTTRAGTSTAPDVTVAPTALGANLPRKEAGAVRRQATATVGLDIRNREGYLTHCDPTLTDISADTGTTFQQSIGNVPETESTLAIVNGWTGLKQMDVTVNGTTFQWDRLRSGEKRTLDLSSAMQPGNGNTISLQGYRKAGGRASLLLHSGP